MSKFFIKAVWRLQNRKKKYDIFISVICLFFLIFSSWWAERSPYFMESELPSGIIVEGQKNPISLEPKNPLLMPHHQLSTFCQKFPLRKNMVDLMRQFYDAANEHSLLLYQGNYRLIEGEGIDSPLIRYEIIFPVKGSYSAVRGFISEALIQLPTLSLDGITLARANANESMVEAELRMTLYMRPE